MVVVLGSFVKLNHGSNFFQFVNMTKPSLRSVC